MYTEDELISIAKSRRWRLFDVLSYYTGKSSNYSILKALNAFGDLARWSSDLGILSNTLIEMINHSMLDECNFTVRRCVDNAFVKCTVTIYHKYVLHFQLAVDLQ